MDAMQPNRFRIPGDHDPAAQAILRRVPTRIDQQFLDSLDPDAASWLGRYGVREVATALRHRSPDLLHQALLATAIATCLQPSNWDDRDLMVTITLHWVAAQQLSADPATMFADTAARIPSPQVAQLLTEFGARTDITLKTFGWEQITTEHGPDFRPLPWPTK